MIRVNNTILYLINNTDDEQIKNLYRQLYDQDLFLLFNTLEFVDEEIQRRWYKIYNEMYKGSFK